MKSRGYRVLTALLFVLGGADWANAQFVKGNGTANTIPVWTSPSTIGNSIMVQSSTRVKVAGSVSATNLNLTGTLALPQTTSSSAGVISFGGVPVFHFFGSQNTFVGQAGNFTMTGLGNIATGYNAFISNTTGNFNVAMGNGALYYNNTGASNTATGTEALFYNTSGSANVATGEGALSGNTTGSWNSVMGYQVLAANITGNYNSALGFRAIGSQSSGDLNTAAGFYALWGNATGGHNTAVGSYALAAGTTNPTLTGSNNTAIGYEAGYSFGGSESNNIDINNLGITGDSGVIRIGTSGTQTQTFVAGISGATTGLTGVPVLVDANGQLGTLSSSWRFKYDIESMGEASGDLMKLRPVTFRYKQAQKDGSHPLQYGLVAEEVAQVYPGLVQYDNAGEPQSVLYHLLPAMLLNEVQKQHQQIEAQSEVMQSQEEQLKTQEERLRRLETLLLGNAN